MGRFRLENLAVKSGGQCGQYRVDLVWTRDWLLRSVRWAREATQVGDLIERAEIPSEWNKFLLELSDFLDQGNPLPGLPWTMIDQSGWTEFQSQVFLAASRVPHGETRPYSWISKKVGKVFAHRAVGQALRANPLLIVIPCHRVVSADGKLGGFMGQDDPAMPELQFKRRLLELEHQYRNPYFQFVGTDQAQTA